MSIIKDNIIYQTVDIDVTGAGKFIINGFNSAENSVIDFTDLTGFTYFFTVTFILYVFP